MSQEAQSAQAYNQQQAYAQQQAVQQPYYGQRAYAEQYPYGAYPPPQPPAPQRREELTGGQKFGWFLIGLLMSIPGILIAWLTNGDSAPQVRSSAVKFAVIGFVIEIVGAILTGVIIGGAFAVVFAELLDEMGVTYYTALVL